MGLYVHGWAFKHPEASWNIEARSEFLGATLRLVGVVTGLDGELLRKSVVGEAVDTSGLSERQSTLFAFFTEQLVPFIRVGDHESLQALHQKLRRQVRRSAIAVYDAIAAEFLREIESHDAALSRSQLRTVTLHKVAGVDSSEHALKGRLRAHAEDPRRVRPQSRCPADADTLSYQRFPCPPPNAIATQLRSMVIRAA